MAVRDPTTGRFLPKGQSGVEDFDIGWKRIKRDLKALAAVKVGVQGQEAKVDRGLETTGAGISQAGLAAVHEFGAPSVNVPQRSYLRSTVDEKQRDYFKELLTIMRNHLAAKTRIGPALKQLGERVRNDIVNKVLGGLTPPLADRTVSQRTAEGFAPGPPLVKTGELMDAITWKLE